MPFKRHRSHRRRLSRRLRPEPPLAIRALSSRTNEGRVRRGPRRTTRSRTLEQYLAQPAAHRPARRAARR